MTLLQIAADTLARRTPSADGIVHPDSLHAVAQLLPDAPPTPLETIMLQQDKLYVVAAVLTLIWLGVAWLLLANDRRLDRLERALDARDGTRREGAGRDGDAAL